jgi:hypothetical protein
MYVEYITYSFSTAIGPYVCGSWNITKQKKIEKIMECPSIKSVPLWYCNGFSPKIKTLLWIYCSKIQKNTHFLNEISSKILKI